MDGKGNVYQILTISKTQRKRQDERVNGVLTISFKVYVCVSASCVDFAAWQHPYVNIFKHVRVEEWKRSAKQGDVSTHMVAFRQNTQPLHLVLQFWDSLLWPNKPFVSSFIFPPRARRWSVQCYTSGLLSLPTATSWYQRTVTSLWGWQAATSTCSSGRALGNTLWSTWMFVPRYQTRFLFFFRCLCWCFDIF